MGCDDQRELYPAIFAAVRVGLISIEAPLLRLVIHWLGDYARLKQQPGQAGVPEGLPAALTALAEAYAAVSDSRQRQEFCADAAGVVRSGYDLELGTTEAAAELGISAGGVRWRCAHGNLEHRKVGRQLMISTASIKRLKSRLDEQRGA